MPRKKRTDVQVRWKNRPKGRYATLRLTVDGKRSERALGYVTEAEAEEMRLDQVAALRLGLQLTDASSGPLVVADLLIAFGRDVEERHHHSVHSRREVRNLITLSRELGDMLPERVSASSIRRYVQTRARQVSSHTKRVPKRSTIIGEVETLIRAFRYGKDLGLIDCDAPARPSKTTLPDDSRPARRLTEAEVRAILDSAYADHRPDVGSYMQMLAWSGRRPVALRSIRLCDCDRLPAEVYYPADKGGRSTGWGPLTKPAADALAQRVAQLEGAGAGPEQLLWTRVCGAPLDATALWKTFTRVAKRAGVRDAQPYDLRKFAVIRIYGAVGSVRTTMKFSGHTDPTTLITNYIYSEQGAAEAAAPTIDWTPAKLTLAEELG